MRNFVGQAFLAICLLGLSACTGGNNTGNGIPSQVSGTCDPGTQTQVVASASNNTQVIVVANGNNNTLFNTYTSWDIVAQDTITGSVYTTGPLNLVSNKGYPQPYSSNFYYSGTFTSGIPSGRTYNAGLNIYTSNCNPNFIGTFST